MQPPKNIIICLDGTWNDPTDNHPTNVHVLSEALEKNNSQQVFYYPGIGNEQENNWAMHL